MGVEVRVLRRPVGFFHATLENAFLCGSGFVHGDIVMLTTAGNGLSQTVGTESCENTIVKNVTVALRFPFTGAKGPKP